METTVWRKAAVSTRCLLYTSTSLPDETVIDLYHAHGESEQYHSEIKTDMDVGRLPSGKFENNKLVLELTMIAYNICLLYTSFSAIIPAGN